MQPASRREAVASWRSVSTISARSSGANFSRTTKLIMKAASFCAPEIEHSSICREHISSLRVNAVERRGKLRQKHRLVPVRASRDHSDLRPALPFLKAQILPCRLGQFVEFGNSLGRTAPALHFGVDRLDLFQPLHVGGNL